MTVIVCVDERFGMVFNNRRQSRDSAVIEKILELSAGKKLWMNSYSRSLFPDDAAVCVSDQFLKNAGTADICFVENCDVAPFLEKAEQIILFYWNRRYPAQLYFPEFILKEYNRTQQLEFSGNSHENITMEVYSR